MDSPIPSVSIICTTYNHCAYIAECLDSLLSQKVDFHYEIIVHDDASTDGTADIIRQYRDKYPGRIKAILQAQNIFSQGISSRSFIDSAIGGKYVAFCEGDDYWTDKNKLQAQYDYLEGHPECTCSVHAAVMVHGAHGKKIGYIKPSSEERDYSLEEVVIGGGGLFATNSMFFKREFFSLPNAFSGWGIGDWPRMILCAINGSVHYIPRVMSAYRAFTPGSWTIRSSTSVEKSIATRRKIIAGLQSADAFTNHENHDVFESAISEIEMRILMLEGNWTEATRSPSYAKMSRRRKVNGWLESHSPSTARLLRNLYFYIPRLR